MKNKFWILILGALFALCLVLSLFLMTGSDPSTQAEIRSGGQVVRIVDLGIDQQFQIPAPDGGSNTITVQDGKLAVTEADCPDGYCMARGFRNSGTQIVCLPHALVITFMGESEVDGAAG